LPGVRLRLSPALRRLTLAHDVLEAWRALEDGAAGEVPAPAATRTEVAVWRQGFDVYHAALAADEAEALRRAAAGRPLGEVCEPFAGRAAPAQAAFETLTEWLADGWVAAIEEPT